MNNVFIGTALCRAGLVNTKGRYLWQLVTGIVSAIEFKKEISLHNIL